MKELAFGLVSVGIFAFSAGFQTSEVTYHGTIAPIIKAKCLPCHSKEVGYAPFDFSTYDGVTSRIQLIRNQVLAQSMPPIWAHSDFGKLSTVDPVTDEEAVLIQKWIQNKMPLGVKSGGNPFVGGDPAKGKVSTFSFAKGVIVHAEGLPYWSVTSVPLPSKGGSFNAFGFVPTNPRAIRYATLAVVSKTMSLPSETSGSMDIPGQQIVGIWAPGYRSWQLPLGMSRKYRPGSKLVVQVHYRPSGKEESGAFKVELERAQVTKDVQPEWLTLEKKDLVIPAGKSETVELTYPVTKDLKVISILPEARFYAGRIQLIYTAPGGQPKNVFESMRWDPYWVGNYMFPEPIKLAKGGKLTARFSYDNDEFCRVNEGKKPQPVKAGPTAADEVCRMHLMLASQRTSE